MRIFLAFVLLFSITGCADFGAKPRARSVQTTTAQPKDNLKAAETAYDGCIKKKTDTTDVTTASNADHVSNLIIASCAPELHKISEAFGKTLTNKVKSADPVATGKFYASAYESKTKKALVLTVEQKKKSL